MINAIEQDQWIYFKLYLGSSITKIDALIQEVVPKALERGGFSSWFFLRYFDEKGIHIRIRFKAEADMRQTLARDLADICQEALHRLPLLPETDYRAMVYPPGQDPDDMEVAIPNAKIFLADDQYEQELEKYGGTKGIEFAEEAFRVSSEIAWKVLDHEQGGMYHRKTVVPCFMQAVVDSFLPKEGAAEFWKNYCFYWLGGETPAAQDWRDRFADKGQDLREKGVPVIADDLEPSAGSLLSQWHECMEKAAEAYAGVSKGGDVTRATLAFNFVHMMNNRLGLYSLEEAYMAALLEQLKG